MKTEIKTRKTIPLCGGAEAHVELLTGKNIIKIPDITDDEMGVTIAHIMQQNGDGNNDFCCGANMRLNLHEKFVKNENGNYIYTDSMGDNFVFNEYYTYVKNDGKKDRVSKENVTVLDDGNLVYNDGTTVFPVEREVVTYDGLKASTKLEGVKNIEDYEQRTDELRQAEERYESYIDTYRDCVICTEDGTVETSISELNAEKIKVFVNAVKNIGENKYVLTKSEATNLQALKKNQALLYAQTSDGYLRKMSKTNTRSIDKLVTDIRVLAISQQGENANQIQNRTNGATYLWETLCDYYIYNINTGNFPSISVANTDRANFCLAQYHLTNGSIHEHYKNSTYEYVLHRNELYSYLSCKDQLASVNSQITLLKEMSKQHKERILEYFDELERCEEAIKNLKLQTPVNFVMRDDGTKGFNENGDLVVIYNKRGNYIAVEYENYYNGTNSLRRICKLYDDKKREITFAYDHKDRISEITNSKGQAVRFEYTGEIFFHVYYPNGQELTFYFDNNNVRVTDSYGSRYMMNLEEDELVEIIQYSSVGKVSHGETETSSEGYTEIANIEFDYYVGTYDFPITSVSDSETEVTEFYKFNEATERLLLYAQEKRNIVISAESYDFFDAGTKTHTTTKAKRNTLYTSPFSDFEFVSGDYTQKVISIFNHKISDKKVVHEGDISKIELSEYTYTPKDQISSVKTTFTVEHLGIIQEEETKVRYEIYEYNSVGALMCKKSYTEGEESINGIDIEEHVYDENGCEIKTVKYNSLDPSSKFYTEKEYDETGKEISQFDVTGKHKTVFVYDKDGVSSKIYPNGSKISYGESDIDCNSAVTISTEDGEESSIQVLCTNGFPTKVKSGNDEYEFEYDNKGRKTLVKLNGSVLAQSTYTDGNDEDQVSVTEKGITITSTDDKSLKRKIVEKGRKRITNQYDSRERLSTVHEYAVGSTAQTTYTYDDLDRVTSCERVCDNLTSKEEYTYDIHGNISSKTVTNVNGTVTYNYEYSTDSKRQLKKVTTSDESLVIVPKVDNLGRNIGKKIGNVIDDTITYVKHGSHATNMPASITYADGSKISYKYDSMGNIVKVFENGILSTEYEYDSVGRLVRENNKKQGTRVYKYDRKGNILSSTAYSYSQKTLEELEMEDGVETKYVYDNKGMLLKFGASENAYLDDGRCSKYKDEDIIWNGKELVKHGAIEFTYDVQGRRVTKNSISYTYDVKGRLIKQSNGVSFIYDHESLIGFKYDGNTYYYRKDPFGSIVAILDTSGNVVVKYTYDAWGNNTVTDFTDFGLGGVNPIRYRGYYYDSNTRLYYLKTRYYDPAVGRFISMDDVEYIDPETIGGVNLFAYCNNNPVMNADPSGNFLISLLVGAAISAAVGFGGSIISQSTTGDRKINWGQVALDTIIGGISGALGASGINQAVSLVAGGVLGAIGSVGGDLISSNGDWSKVNVGKAILMGAIGVGLGRWTGAGTQNTKVMVGTINAGKSWGSKAFLTSAKEALLRPNSGLTLQTMYMNMAKAISLYTVHGITKVSAATFGSTMFGNMIG